MISKRMRSRILLCSASALLASMTAMAQNQPGGAGGGQQPSQQQPGQQPGGPGGAMESAGPQNQQAMQAMADQSFVKKALEGGAAEVQLGQLAQQKSQSADVQQFGQKMVADHTQLGDQIKPIAQQLRVKEPNGPSKKDKELIAKLQGLSGEQFDQTYINAMVKDHKQDLKEFKTEAQQAQDPNVKQVAQQGAQVISQHLQLIEQIAQSHNVPTGGKSKGSPGAQ